MYHAFGHKVLLISLLALRYAELANGCICKMAHPQEYFCHSDLVFRAKVIGEKVVSPTNSSYHWDTMIRYEIKLIKMFKGFEKAQDIQYLYTPSESSLCGTRLNSRKTHYLLTGYVKDGKVNVDLCNLVKPWKHLTVSQKRNLKYGYYIGCSCKIIDCYSENCSTQPNECPWAGWLPWGGENGHLALHYACVKLKDGFCKWIKSSTTLEKNILNTSEP